MKYTMTLHPNGLSPLESAKAWYLRVEGKKPWSAVRKKVKTVAGKRPGQRALENAVKRQGQLARTEPFPKLNYANCGRKGDLTEEQRQSVVDFVTKWRSKRFCTAAYIIRERAQAEGQEEDGAPCPQQGGVHLEAGPAEVEVVAQGA